MPMLRFCDLEKDAALVEKARDATDRMLLEHHELALKHASRWFQGKAELLTA